MIKEIKEKFFFKPQSVRGTILKNFLWLFAGNAGSHLLRGLIIVYAARVLGAAGYGTFSYALGLAGFFAFFKNIGVDTILTREVAKQPEKQHYYFATAFWIEIILLAITAFLIIFVAPFFSGVKEAIVLFPFVALIIIFDDLKDLFVAFFRGIEKMEWEALVTVATNIAIVVFGFGALLISVSPLYLALAYAAASLFGALLAGGIIFVRHVRGFFRSFNKNMVVPILKSAWPFAVGGLAGAFLFNVDIVMLGWWRGTEEIGLYSAAQKIVGILAIFSGFIATVTLPKLSHFAYSDQQKMRHLLESSLKIIFITAFPLVIGGLILKSSIMGFIFGSSYLPATNAFAILLFSILAVHPLAIISTLLFVFDKQAKAIKYALTSSLCNIVLNFLLIPKYGMEGAAVATSISFFVYIILLWRAGKAVCKFHIVSELLKPALATLVMGFLVYILKTVGINFLINIAVSGMFYFACLYFLKEKILVEFFSFLRSGLSKFV